MLNQVDDTQKFLQSKGLSGHQCAAKIRALATFLSEKRHKFLEEGLSFAKNLADELGIEIPTPTKGKKEELKNERKRL